MDLEQLDDAQCIALSWLVETERFARLAADPASASRVLRIDGEAMLAQPAEHLAKVARHLELSASDTEIVSAIQSGVLQRYAKQTGRHYDNAARTRELAEAESRFAGEIEAAVAWCNTLSTQLVRLTN